MKKWVLGGVGVLGLALAGGCGEKDEAPGSPPDDSSPAGAPSDQGGSSSDAGSPSVDGGEPPVGAAGEDGNGGGTGGSGGSGGSGGTGGRGGSGGGGGAGGVPATVPFQSRPAGIELELDDASQKAGFSLSSSSITQDKTGSLIYVEWLAELVNGTDETQCLIGVSGDFQDAQGASLIKLDTYAQGPAYDMGGALKLTSSCVGPGKSVPIWSNDLPDVEVALGSIKKLVVKLTPIASPDAVVHPMTPTLSGLTKTYSSTFEQWAIAATATATDDIYNLSVTFWGKDGAFFVDSEKDYHLENFFKGDTWAIDTAPLGLETKSLTEVIPYFSFIEGTDASPRLSLNPRSLALVERRNEVDRTWRALEERRSRFRAH